MAESEFQHEFCHSLWQNNYHVVIIPDDGKANLSFGDRFKAKKKPYDAVAGMPTKRPQTLALEFKQVKRGLSFAFSAIEEHQWEGLECAEGVGWHGLVVVNFRLRPTAAERKRLQTEDFALDRAYVFPIGWIRIARKKAARSGIALDDPLIEEFRINTEDDGDGWNVSDLERIIRVKSNNGFERF